MRPLRPLVCAGYSPGQLNGTGSIGDLDNRRENAHILPNAIRCVAAQTVSRAVRRVAVAGDLIGRSPHHLARIFVCRQREVRHYRAVLRGREQGGLSPARQVIEVPTPSFPKFPKLRHLPES